MAWSTPPPDSTEEQKFNMGLAELERIHQKFCAYDSFAMRKDIVRSFDILKLIYDDVDFCLKKIEVDELNAEEKKLNDLITSVDVIDGVYEVNKGGKTSRFYQHPRQRVGALVLLREYHRLIRRAMKSHGLLMPEKEESSLF